MPSGAIFEFLKDDAGLSFGHTVGRMRTFPFLLALAITAIAVSAGSERDALRDQARAAAAQRDPAAASDLYEKAAAAAIASGDPRTAFHDLHSAGAAAYEIFANERVISIERRAIALADQLLPGLAGVDRETVRYGRIECQGFLERALSNLGRLAEGHAELRKVWRGIEDYRVTEESGPPGDPRQAADLPQWSSRIRTFYWRAMTREAEYLDFMGRSHEAVALLWTALAQIPGVGPMETAEKFYAAKIRPALSLIVGFLGSRREAIEIQRAGFTDPVASVTGPSYWSARMNLLRDIQRHEGPGRANLDEAEAAHRQLTRLSPNGRHTQSAVLLEKMRAFHDANYDSAGNLRRLAAEFRDETLVFDGLYAERAALVASATKPGLDGEFVRLLNEMRKRGNKRAEPSLYVEYAAYLRRMHRPADALPLYREARRLTEAFGWTFHIPRLRIDIIATLYELGDAAAAEAGWIELDRLVAGIADFPPERALHVRVARIRWHLMRGERKKAAQAFEEARVFADAQKMSAWLRRSLDSIQPDAPVTAAANGPPVPPEAAAASLQPVRVVTSAAPRDPLRARFALRNPGTGARTGEFRVRGPGIQAGLGISPRRITGSAAAGNAENEVRFPLVLTPGEELGVVLDMNGSPATGSETGLQITWRDSSGEASAAWHVKKETDPFVVSILNANLLRRNAFYAVSFTHQIVRRDGGPGLANIRFVASTPLRLEYYDAVTHRLLAVDAEGNGSFADPGDVLEADADSNLVPDVAFDGRARLREIEVVVFPGAAGVIGAGQHIVAELLAGDRWEQVSRNDLE
jgi:hypothetical protein